MEARYKSLAAMDAAPWIEHFKKTAGHTSILSSQPRPVVIKKPRSSSDAHGEKANVSLPLTIVSPVGQSNEMAEADLRMESDKRVGAGSAGSVGSSATSGTQRSRKRKQPPHTPQSRVTSGAPKNKKAKITRIKDIFG